MSKSLRNIYNLTKLLLINSFFNFEIIDKKNKKINKKSIYLWLIITILITTIYISYESIKTLIEIKQETVFLSVFFLILMIAIIFQVILASSNVYFTSKDIELILPLPFKSKEILISKFNTILIKLYFFEIIFALFPLIIFGIYTYVGISYYLSVFIILLIFPILPTLIVSIIITLFMKLSKFVRNKDIFQIILTLIFIGIIFTGIYFILNNIVNRDLLTVESSQEIISEKIEIFNNKIKNINKYFLGINLYTEILEHTEILNIFIKLIKIIFFNLLFLIILIFLSNKIYLENILRMNNYKKIKKINKTNLNKKTKKLNIAQSYIKYDIKKIIKNPVFFMQCIYPILILCITIFVIVGVNLDNIINYINMQFLGGNNEFEIDLNTVCIVLGFLQLIFTMSNLSITAFSREGKSAIYMKFIPVDLYKQYIYKNVPQILINSFIILTVVIIINIIIKVTLINNILFIVLSMLLNILYSLFMTLVDLLRPNINWNSEYEIIKQNNNKIFQYVITIIIILLLIYFSSILSTINFSLACLIISFILAIIILIFNIIVKKNIYKFYSKIN